MKDLAGARVIVAGGAGFVGGHLVRAALRQGADVTAVDNLSTGKVSILAEFTDSRRLELIEHDVSLRIKLEGDILFNLACPASPKHSQRDPLNTWKTAVLGAMHLGEMAVERGMVFVQGSTSEVYGDPEVHPQSEDYCGKVFTTGIRACYDEGKRAAETYLSDLQRMSGLDLRIARIFNTYGPEMSLEDGRVVPNFVLQALRGMPFSIYGDGLQTRSLCYVSDLVRGLIALATAPGNGSGIVNLGNPNEQSVRQIAELVCELTGSAAGVEHCALPQHDPLRRRPDIGRAQSVLGWSPHVDVRTGRTRTIQDIRERLKQGVT